MKTNEAKNLYSHLLTKETVMLCVQTSEVVKKFYQCLAVGEEYSDDAWRQWQTKHPSQLLDGPPQMGSQGQDGYGRGGRGGYRGGGGGGGGGGGRGSCFKCGRGLFCAAISCS